MGRLWSRAFAGLYDFMTARGEEAGMGEMRTRLLGEATGRTVEIGAGTGHNIKHYQQGVAELVLTEPSEFMAAKLRDKVASSNREATVVEASAMALPFDDDSFDTAVSTLVLCTVPDAAATLSEIARVLKPGGRLLFIEHVRSQDPGLAKWQDRLERPWKAFGDGCHCNRDTLATIEASPLTVERVEHERFAKAPKLVEPLIVGTARAA